MYPMVPRSWFYRKKGHEIAMMSKLQRNYSLWGRLERQCSPFCSCLLLSSIYRFQEPEWALSAEGKWGFNASQRSGGWTAKECKAWIWLLRDIARAFHLLPLPQLYGGKAWVGVIKASDSANAPKPPRDSVPEEYTRWAAGKIGC